jgi:hypothetical protein
MTKLITMLSPLEAEAFETQCYVEAFKRLKKKGFPADQGKFFVFLDNWGLTEENLKPLGLEIAGRNLVKMKGEVVIA